MRRRMTALHQQLGGGVLRSFNPPGKKPGKWWVNTTMIAAHHNREELDDEREQVQSALGEHLLRIEAVERKVQAVRDQQIGLKKRVVVLEQLSLPLGNTENLGPT